MTARAPCGRSQLLPRETPPTPGEISRSSLLCDFGQITSLLWHEGPSRLRSRFPHDGKVLIDAGNHRHSAAAAAKSLDTFSSSGFWHADDCARDVIVENQCERTKALSTKRRSLWLARIKRANLDIENRNLRVCGAHFIAGKPAKLFDETDPDWAPSLLLGPRLQRQEHGSLTTPTPRKTTRRKAASGRRKAGSRIAGTACRGRRGSDRDPAVCRSAPLARRTRWEKPT
ncbi:hypothetical protein HPB49_001948 [Dermacentor silvarum]|uniref:Uncharacterized protein n=1 Tax=Dermacentor silvarum TaxID=543639 RepID=A0ACB8DT24_DERSI|nr:hypothetical protein HPB49_001948 [Dermacentor silvarum]